MCGIAGVVGGHIAEPQAMEMAEKMAYQLRHRGPDSAAYYLDDRALLVHTRLSIIDLAGGIQPIHNEDKSLWVIFNGEIYNYVELRAELEQKGHRFYTHSDTEVIVHLYEEYGDDYASFLNGQFAIALWSIPERKLLLTRDRVGITPLFYCFEQEQIWFASEVKAILAAQQRSRNLNKEALDQLLTYWAPTAPATVFEGILEVQPGCSLIFKNGQLEEHRYWDWLYCPREACLNISEEEAAEHVDELLLDATRIRLRADVPVAAYLSGGLDSSVLVTNICRLNTAKLRTFSLTFEEKDLDEQVYQDLMVEALGTDHSRVLAKNQDIGEQFLDAIWYTEAPIVRTAPIPLGQLSKLAQASDFKVVLTGEGADEVFGGYDLFKETKLRGFWSVNPDSQFRPLLLKKLYPYLVLNPGKAQAYLQNFFGGGVDHPETELFSHQPRRSTTEKIKQFYHRDLLNQSFDDPDVKLLENLPDDFQSWPLLSKAQYVEAKTLMAGYLLCSQGDRMLMKNSVEGRFPFLDHRVIEFANRLNPNLRIKVLNEKFILKKAMQERLPKAITQRYKQPYRAPNIPSFFSGQTPEYVETLLSEKMLSDTGYFDPKRVAMLVKKIKAGRSIGYKDNMALVSILSTQAWHWHFISQFDQHFGTVGSTQLQRIH